MNKSIGMSFGWVRAWLSVTLMATVLLHGAGARAESQEQKRFASPEAAVQALVEAAKAGDRG